MVTQTVLATVEKGRLAKAAESYAAGAYDVTLASQSDAEIRGFVASGDGKQYGLVLTPERVFCSCPDSIFRHTVCKHAVVLALHVIRTPKEEAIEEARPVSLKLGKVRQGFVFAA